MTEQARDVERIRFTTAEFEVLQGLRSVVKGGWALGVWVASTLVGDVAGLVLVAVVTVVALVAHTWVGRWYARRLGTVQGSTTTFDFGSAGTSTARRWTAALVALSGFAVDLTAETLLPVTTMLITTGIATVILAWPARRRRVVTVAGGAALVLLGALPWPVDAMLRLAGDDDVAGAKLGVTLLSLGIVTIVQGLIDHRRLERELEPAGGDVHERRSGAVMTRDGGVVPVTSGGVVPVTSGGAGPRDLEQVRFLAANFRDLQGLRAVVVLVPALWAGLTYAGVLPWFVGVPWWADLLAVVALVAVTAGLHRMVDGWYRHRFGLAASGRIPGHGPDAVSAARRRSAVVLASVGSFLVGFGEQQVVGQLASAPPISVSTIVIAVAYAIVAWPLRRRAPHQLVGAGVLAVLGATPPVVAALGRLAPSSEPDGAALVVTLVLVASVGIVASLLDHRLLARSLAADDDAAIDGRP